MTGDRPLSDVTVVELGHIVAGPFCSMLLADLGADVVKVEHPGGGDAIRDSSPMGASSFNYVNRDKESITLDLKAERGKEVFYDLVAEADVVVENFGPGTADRLDVGYEAIQEQNLTVVYCSIKGFNPGPYENYPALDPVAEAMSGHMSTTGNPGQPPVRSGTSLADMAASLYGAFTVAGAIRQRDQTGEGQFVEVPLYESTVSLMGYWLAYTQAYDDIPEPLGAGHPNWSPYDVFRTEDDRWLFIGPSSQRQWVALCDVLDCDLHERGRYETISDRRENDDQLTEELGEYVETFEAEPLQQQLQDAGVPAAIVRNVAEVSEDEHLEATEALTDIQTAEGRDATVSVPRFPVRSSRFDRIESTDPPELGEDTDVVLEAMGYDDETIADLHANDVV
jgi:itaconate CoA-transferase